MENINNGTVNIFDWIEHLSVSNPNFSSQNRECRQAFFEFLDNNKYFGVKKLHGIREKTTLFIRRSEAEKIRPNLELWLRAYGVGSNEKLKLLAERMKILYPNTGALFSQFMDYSRPDSNTAWKLADYLCFVLHKEIDEMNSNELDNLAENMNRELTLNSSRLFSEFLMYALLRLQHSSSQYSECIYKNIGGGILS